METPALRLFIRNVIKEAKEKQKQKKPIKKESSLPKSSGKLIDLKKELAALKTMKEELQVAKFAEKTAETEVEFANLAKFATELDKIKQGGVALEAKIDAKITELETKIDAEKNKIREMIGLTPSKGQEQIEDVQDPEIDEIEAPVWMNEVKRLSLQEDYTAKELLDASKKIGLPVEKVKQLIAQVKKDLNTSIKAQQKDYYSNLDEVKPTKKTKKVEAKK